MSGASSAEASTVDNYHVIELVGEGSFGKARMRCLDRGCQPVLWCLGRARMPAPQVCTALVFAAVLEVFRLLLLERAAAGRWGLAQKHSYLPGAQRGCLRLQVYKGRRKFTGQITAMKFIGKHGKSEKDVRSLRQEIEILSNLRHENIIKMLDWFETKTDFCVVTEFAHGAPPPGLLVRVCAPSGGVK